MLTTNYWQVRMTDPNYREWIQKQRSCISGKFSECVNGEMRNIACHVRRANSSGVGFKGNNLVPMTNEEHNFQHRFGESGLLRKFRPELRINTAQDAKDWFDSQAKHYHTLYQGRKDGYE